MRFSRNIWLLALAAMVGGGAAIAGSQQRGQLPPTTGTGLVAGQVIDATSRRPIPAATVTLIARTGGAIPRPVIADSQGRFFFADLRAGAYSVQVTKPGYSAATIANLSRLIDVADGERITDVKIRLAKMASLSGTVRDDGGDPVVGTGMIVFRRTLVNGRPALRPFGLSRTDDRGAYRVGNLQAGEYIICACMRDPMPLDGLLLTTLASEPLHLMSLAARALKVGADAAGLDNTLRTFAPTFYPDSSTIARATRVKIAPGEEKSGVDLDVAAIRATRVSGTIIGAVSPLQASSIRLVPAGESEEGAAVAQLQPALVQPDGRFDFAGVPPGQYVLRVTHTVTTSRGGSPSGAALAFLGARGAGMNVPTGPPVQDDSLLWTAEPIVVPDTGVSGLAMELRRGTKISGRLQFVGAAAQPVAQMSRAAVFVQAVNPDSTSAGAVIGRVSGDATFQVAGVVPGRYVINSTGFPGWLLKSVSVAGQDVTDMPVDIDANDLNDVTLTFTDAPMSRLDATVPALRAAAEDLSLLMFPADRRYWQDPAAARRRFQTVAFSRNGTAPISMLPAGEYFLTVVPDEAAADWQDAGKLETLSRGALRVQLAEGEKKTVELKR